MTSRSSDIVTTLGYAYACLGELSAALLATNLDSSTIPFLSQRVTTILKECHDCLDYAARDIEDKYPNPRPNERVFFPTSRVKLRRRYWEHLKTADSALHQHLSNLVDAIENRRAYRSTIFSHHLLAESETLVNEKKHNLVLRTALAQGAAARIVGPDGSTVLASAVYPFKGETPDFGVIPDATPWEGHGLEVQHVTQCHLEANNWEVGRFCLHTIEITWRVLEDLYCGFFGLPPNCFNPRETSKPSEQRRLEAGVNAVLPMSGWPLVVAARCEGATVAKWELGFGQCPTKDTDRIHLLEALIQLFWGCVWPQASAKLMDLLKRTVVECPTHDFSQPRYVESQIGPLAQPLALRADEVTVLVDEVIFGIGVRFRESAVSVPLDSPSELAQQLVQSFFPTDPTAYAVFNRPLA